LAYFEDSEITGTSIAGTTLLILRDFDPAPDVAGCVIAFPVTSLIPFTLLERERLGKRPDRLVALEAFPLEVLAGWGSRGSHVDVDDPETVGVPA
jgi:hypothetical protein